MRTAGAMPATLAALALCLACLQGMGFMPVVAVDSRKFRTCQDTGFCRRNRHALPPRHTVDPQSLSYQDSGVLTGRVVAQPGGPKHLQGGGLELSVSLYDSGVARVRITESQALGLPPRWEASDVLMPLVPVKGESLAKGDTRRPEGSQNADVVLAYGAGGRYVLAVSFDPLRFDLYVDGAAVAAANAAGKLHFERRKRQGNAGSRAGGEGSADAPASGDGAGDSQEGPEMHGDKEVVDYGEDGKAVYADGSRETDEEHRARKAMGSGAARAPAGDLGLGEERFDGHADTKPNGAMSVGIDVWFPGAQQVYGLPEHTAPLALPATTGPGAKYSDPYRLYSLDVFEYDLDVPMALYGAVPLAISHGHRSSGGGGGSVTAAAFWWNPSETFADVSYTHDGGDEAPVCEAAEGEEAPSCGAAAAPAGRGVHWLSESGVVDLMLLPGPSPADVFKQYMLLTGAPAMPPRFATAFHQCRWNYRDEADVAAVDAGFEKEDIPYDVLWLDIEHTDGKRYFTWDKTHFPNPIAMQDKLAERGRKMVTIVDPHIKRDDAYSVHKAATSLGYYIKDSTGKDFDGWCWPGSSSYLDFTDPQVRKWWAEQFGLNNYKGSTRNLFIWNDMNEPSVFNGPEVSMRKDCLSRAGVEHREWHNLYGMYMHRATAEGVMGRGLVARPAEPARPFVLSRAFAPGTQRWGAVWTGDNKAAWDHLRIAAPMLLSLSLAGIPFVGADVGGFFGDPSAELFTRWMQAGAYQPFFRSHAHHDSIRAAIMARYALLPYWYTLFAQSSRDGMPPMRPMWVEFPLDAKTLAMDDQWMAGPALLVKPVTAEGEVQVPVYLPGAEQGLVWYNTDTHERVRATAGEPEQVDAPLDRIPVFQRGGTIVPKQLRLRRCSTLMRNDPYTLVVALDANGEAQGELYLDDGESFDYTTQGGHALRHFRYTGGKLTATAASGTYAPDNAIERIVVLGLPAQPQAVTATAAAPGGSSEQRALEFQWSGKAAVLVIRQPRVGAAQDFEIVVA